MKSALLFLCSLLTINAAFADDIANKIERIQKYLDYHNVGSEVKIEMDRWYRVEELFKTRHDLPHLMTGLQRDNVFLLIEKAFSRMNFYNRQRFWTTIGLYEYKNIPEFKIRPIDPVREYNTMSFELANHRELLASAEHYFLIPSSPKLQSPIDYPTFNANTFERMLEPYNIGQAEHLKAGLNKISSQANGTSSKIMEKRTSRLKVTRSEPLNKLRRVRRLK